MRAALLAPILPRVMKERESKWAALILMKNSHFDRTLRYIVYQTHLFFKNCRIEKCFWQQLIEDAEHTAVTLSLSSNYGVGRGKNYTLLLAVSLHDFTVLCRPCVQLACLLLFRCCWNYLTKMKEGIIPGEDESFTWCGLA